MKNKGFTLVELIASLVVLSVISVIVTVNINKSIQNSNDTIYELQLDAYTSAVEQWMPEGTEISGVETMPLSQLSESSDNLVSFIIESDEVTKVEKVVAPTTVENYGYTFVFMPVIEVETSLDEDIISRDNKLEFSDYSFVVIKQSLIEESLNNNSNYKYTYEMIDTNEKMFTFFADLYFELYPSASETTLTRTELDPIIPDYLFRVVESTIAGLINIETLETLETISITVNVDGTYTMN